MRSNELFRFQYVCGLLSTDYSLQVQDGPTRCVQLGLGSWHPSWTSHCFADGTGGSKPSSFGFGVSSATPEQHCLDLCHPARSTWFDEGYQLRSQRSRGWVELSVLYCVQKMFFMNGNHPRREFNDVMTVEFLGCGSRLLLSWWLWIIFSACVGCKA